MFEESEEAPQRAIDEDEISEAFEDDTDADPDDEMIACYVCSCIIGEEVAYGDKWDGRWVCAGCAGVEEQEESTPES